MNYKRILAIDPSGSFNEGKGTTGWCCFDALENNIYAAESISAKNYSTMEEYWMNIENMVESFVNTSTVVVIEDYLLYGSKAENQINSRMETSKLIGILQYWCWRFDVPCILQPASEVKTRWADPILTYKGYLNKSMKIDRHAKDALRHAVHYATFKNGKGKQNETEDTTS